MGEGSPVATPKRKRQSAAQFDSIHMGSPEASANKTPRGNSLNGFNSTTFSQDPQHLQLHGIATPSRCVA